MRYVNSGASTLGSGEAGLATSEPPLYYVLEAVPYWIGTGNILTQLALMRLLSALMSGVTVLLTYLFLREVLPGVSSAVTIGTLCVALQPLLGFMSGTLNPETMLYAVSAGIFLCLARGFRRGLTPPLAIAMGLLIAVGFATKLTFVGFAFGVFIGLIVLGVREVRLWGRESLPWLVAAVGIGVAPVLLVALKNALSGQPILGIALGSIVRSINGSLAHEVSYVWELYMPRLPGMAHYFRGLSTSRAWFDHSVGLYGALDTGFPDWVGSVALIPTIGVAFLSGRAIFVRRGCCARACLSSPCTSR